MGQFKMPAIQGPVQRSLRGGLEVTETPDGGARIEITDAHGNHCGGHLDPDKLAALHKRIGEIINKQNPKRSFIIGG